MGQGREMGCGVDGEGACFFFLTFSSCQEEKRRENITRAQSAVGDFQRE